VAERDSFGGGFPFGVGIIRSDERGGDASRRYGVDSDAVEGEFERQRSRQAEDAGFGRDLTGIQLVLN
jgi:hypothetical protein